MRRLLNSILQLFSGRLRSRRLWQEDLYRSDADAMAGGKVCRLCGHRYMTDGTGRIFVEEHGMWNEAKDPHPWLRHMVESTPNGGCWPSE